MTLAGRAGSCAAALFAAALFHVNAQHGGQAHTQDVTQGEKKSKKAAANGKPEISSPQRSESEARAWQQQQGWLSKGAWGGNVSWEQSRARRWQTDHRTWVQRGGYGGFYIPQARFDHAFGSRHTFHLAGRPLMYQGYPRFEYGGFSFLVVDPWPEYWSDNWYDYDEVYIDYEDGYYLCNPRYPQVKMAIAIAL